MERFDIVIVGAGPAGMSAALTAKNRNKKFLLIGDGISGKVEKAHTVQNYLGLPNISGKDMAEIFRNQLKQMDIENTEKRVSAIYSMGDYFAIQAGDGMIESTTVILATGMANGIELPGEKKYLGRGVSYCATCDAMLYKNKKTIVIGYDKKEEKEAEFLSEVAESVLYIPMYKEETKLSPHIQILRDIPEEVVGEDMVTALKTKNGEYPADGIFILRESIAPEQLVPGLKIEENHVHVNAKMETNIKGCFACGDIAGQPYQYIKSAGQGNVAAISAVKYITDLKSNNQ